MNWFETNSEEDFHNFRSKGIGSSDCPIIMGVSPWMTRHQLWLEKTGIKESDFKGNYATQRGNALEPVVRAWYNDKFFTQCTPQSFVHDEFDYLRCNSDGYDGVNKRLIEIKCGNLEDHINCVDNDVIPEKYYPQVQYLIFLSGVESCDYVSFNDKHVEPYVVVTVEKDHDYLRKLLSEVHIFWDMIEKKIEPELCDRDKVKIDDNDIVELVSQYDKYKQEKEFIDAKIKKITHELSGLITSKRSYCNGYNITWVEKKGSVNYKSIEELKGVDLEQYRKKGTTYLMLKKAKES